MSSKVVQKALNVLSANIQYELNVLDNSGLIIASTNKDRINETDNLLKEIDQSEHKGVIRFHNKLYYKVNVGNDVFYISSDVCSKTAENYCCLISSIIETSAAVLNPKVDREEVEKRILTGKMSEVQIGRYVKDYGVEADYGRCVVLIETPSIYAEKVYNILNKIFPDDESNKVVPIDSHYEAIVNSKGTEEDMDDYIQLSNAINDTIQNEISINPYIGIGSIKSDIYHISESFKEAKEAIEVGKINNYNEHVYVYEHLLLERLIYSIQPEINSKFYNVIFKDDYKKLLSDEMLNTVHNFFENSLNLSETSRQLYIHRNTLVYRLDKIQKITGLDLRNFDDAVTFKIMIMLGKSLANKKQTGECTT